jgi:hypothetical protein
MELECKAWLPGSFSAADQFGAYTFGEVRQKILECAPPPPSAPPAHLPHSRPRPRPRRSSASAASSATAAALRSVREDTRGGARAAGTWGPSMRRKRG